MQRAFLLFQIAAIENSGGGSHVASSSGSEAKVQQLQQKCDLLQKQLDAAKTAASTGSSAPTGKWNFKIYNSQ